MAPTKIGIKQLHKFQESFIREVDLEAGEFCDYKRHFKNVVREVIGYLESQAGKNDSRFCWAFIRTICKRCNQYQKNRKPYSQRQVERALKFLEQLGVIVRIRKMKWRGGIVHGYIVSYHDSGCFRVGDKCIFHRGGLTGFLTGWKPSDVHANLKMHKPPCKIFDASGTLIDVVFNNIEGKVSASFRRLPSPEATKGKSA
jgi:hypothetical protein